MKNENHSRIPSLGFRHTESTKQERRSDHVADTAHFKCGPLLAAGLSTEFGQYLAAELSEDSWHRFRRKVGPEFASEAEAGHKDSSLTIHMEDTQGRGEDHHARVRGLHRTVKCRFVRGGL